MDNPQTHNNSLGKAFGKTMAYPEMRAQRLLMFKHKVGARARVILKENQPFSSDAHSILEEGMQFDPVFLEELHMSENEKVSLCVVPPARPHTDMYLPKEEYAAYYEEYFNRKPVLPSNWKNFVPLHMVLWCISDMDGSITWNTMKDDLLNAQQVGAYWGEYTEQMYGFFQHILRKKGMENTHEIFQHIAVGTVDTVHREFAGWDRSAATINMPHMHIGLRRIVTDKNAVEKAQQLTVTKEGVLEYVDSTSAEHVITEDQKNIYFDQYTAQVVVALSKMYSEIINTSLEESSVQQKVHLSIDLPSETGIGEIYKPHFKILIQEEPHFDVLIPFLSKVFSQLDNHWKNILSHLLYYFRSGSTTLLEKYIREYKLADDIDQAVSVLVRSTPPKEYKAKGVVVGDKILRFSTNVNSIPAANAGFTAHIEAQNGTWVMTLIPSLTHCGPVEGRNMFLVDKK